MNATQQPVFPAEKEPVGLHHHAMDNLRFIRETMERSTAFTAVPGWGTVAMGGTAFLGALASWLVSSPVAWMVTWIATACCALSFGTFSMVRKARQVNESLFAGAGRRFALGMLPPIAAGVVLTLVFYRLGLIELMPGTWLLLYGVGVVTAGAYSVRIVPVMGMSFMVLGGVALWLPFAWADVVMVTGFGIFHIIFGLIIARNYGG